MASNESRSINGCRRNKPIRKESSGKIPEVFIPMDEGVVLPAAVIAVWQVIASLGIVSTTVLPSPVVILQTFQELLLSGELWGHLKISLYRAAAGFLLGAGLGLVFGLLVGFSKRTEAYLDPSLQMLRTVPHLAVTPLFILWFGFDETSKILLIALGAFFPCTLIRFSESAVWTRSCLTSRGCWNLTGISR